MTAPTPAEISTAATQIAKGIGIDPKYLVYKDIMELTPDMPVLLLFNVICEGHPRHGSTLSARLNP
jgi:hypothetical protein